MAPRPSRITVAPRAAVVSPARQLAGFVAKFDPANAKLIRACLSAVRRRLPTSIAQVYDNYNFLAIGFGPNERASDCIVSIAAAANGVGICFIYGARLPDPDGVLLGAGKQTRFVRLPSADILRTPAVERLLSAAIRQAKVPLPKTGGGYTLIKSISTKQRPRRR